MKTKMNKAVSLLLALSMLVSVISISAFATDSIYITQLKATDGSVALDGTEPGVATVALVGTAPMDVFSIQGGWDLKEQADSTYLTLSAIGSDVFTFSGVNYTDAATGALIWSDDTFSDPGVVETGSKVLTATYSVAADTPAGEYTVRFHLVSLTGTDYEPVDTDTYYTAKITVTRAEVHVHTEEEISAVAPTCTQTGLTAGVKCSTCGEILVAQTEVAALGHTEVIDAAVAPTCTATGLTEGKHCSVCNEVLVAQEEVAALGHTEVVDAAVAPTCTETGLTEGKHCSVCNEVLVAQSEVAALGHKDDNGDYKCDVCGTNICNEHAWVTDAAVAPTCTETGLTEGSHCSKCGEVKVAQTEVAALGHTEVIDAAVAPTCTATGLTEGKHCSVCNEILVAQTEVAALGHTEEEIPAVAPTCTQTGLTAGVKCSVCGEILTAQTEVAALGHTWVDATCEVAKHCSVCGLTDGSALGHTEVVDAAVEPTCTETGLTEGKHCSVCNKVLVAQDIIPANGHTDENGDFICEICGQDTCTDHEEVIIPGVAATCTESGLTEGKKCAICGDIILAQEVIPAKGHTEAIDVAVAPTCTEAGKTEGKHCSVCSEVLIAQQPIAALGHAYDENWTSDNNNHWHACVNGCGTQIDIEKHDANPCTICGHKKVNTIIPVGPSEETDEPTDKPVEIKLPFTDAAGQWYTEDVRYVFENGLMNGVSETTFAPNANTTRGMIVTILWRMNGQTAPLKGCQFADVADGSYYELAIAWAAENGIVTGYSETEFKPDANITREQFAAILFRYAQYKGMAAVTLEENLIGYADHEQISSYAVQAMNWAVGQGLINGSDGKLMPAGNATRAQAAAILHRFCENIK